MRTNELASMFDAFEKIFDDSFFKGSFAGNVYPITFPPCDIKIKKEHKDLVLEFAVAGIPKELISLSAEGDYLILNIKELKSAEENVDKYTYLQKRIKTSEVSQKFYIPSTKYHLDKIDVTLKDGILKLEVPAREEQKPKLLQIKYEV